MKSRTATSHIVVASMRTMALGWHKVQAELRTVRFRVLATVLAFLAAGLLVTVITTLTLDLKNLNTRVSEELLLQSERLRNVAEQGSPGGGRFTSLDALFTVFLQGDAPGKHESVMATVNGGNTFLRAGEQPSNLATSQVLETAQAKHVEDRTAFHDMTLDGRTVRLAITSVALGDGGTTGLLVAANEIGLQREQMIASFGTFAVASLATLLLAGAVGSAVTGRLFVPVRRLRQATESITFEDLSARVLVPSGDDDVSQLATDFNRMLDRLEAGITNQRRFVDDASHELRTPLTIIGGHLQLLQADDPQDVSETQVLLLEELDRMQSLVDELHHDSSGAAVEIWVADSGCGISPADQERIFDRFARAGISRGKKGSGLGLSIVKAIAEAHGGSLRVTSKVSEGSRFVLSLPGGTP